MKSELNCLFSLENLTLSYDGRPALHHVRGQIQRGEMLAVSGPNGAGKSSLLKVLSGQIKSFEGKLYRHFNNADRIAYLPQSQLLNSDIAVSVESVVSQGLWPNLPWGGFLRSKDHKRIDEALEKVGMKDLAQEIWSDLSGGLRQRALIARLLCQDASVWILDEPFTALDRKSCLDILSLLQKMNSEGKTIIAVLHDQALIEEAFPRSLVLAREVQYWGPTRDMPAVQKQTEELRHGWVLEPAACVSENEDTRV